MSEPIMTKADRDAFLNRLHSERDELTVAKHQIITQLSEITSACKTRMRGAQYHDLQKKRAGLVAALSKIEINLSAKNSEIRSASTLPSSLVGAQEQRPIVTELCQLRDEYRQFSADRSRVSSMRTMAAEFALKIDKVIRNAMKVPADRTTKEIE